VKVQAPEERNLDDKALRMLTMMLTGRMAKVRPGDAEAAKVSHTPASANAASAGRRETMTSRFVNRDTERNETGRKRFRPLPTETNAALEQSRSICLNLAGWAGRAFRRNEVKGGRLLQ
jgi:hypothetical protein